MQATPLLVALTLLTAVPAWARPEAGERPPSGTYEPTLVCRWDTDRMLLCDRPEVSGVLLTFDVAAERIDIAQSGDFCPTDTLFHARGRRIRILPPPSISCLVHGCDGSSHGPCIELGAWTAAVRFRLRARELTLLDRYGQTVMVLVARP